MKKYYYSPKFSVLFFIHDTEKNTFGSQASMSSDHPKIEDEIKQFNMCPLTFHLILKLSLNVSKNYPNEKLLIREYLYTLLENNT